MFTDFTAVQNYSYDSLNRLKSAVENVTPHGGSAVQSWRQTFTFDRYGNRRFDEPNTTRLPKSCGTPPNQTVCPADVPIVNPTISTANNRLSSTGWQYDAASNTTADPEGRTFTYDGENKQVQVTNSSGAWCQNNLGMSGEPMSVDGSAFRGRDASFDWAREWFGIVVGYALGLPDGSVYEENLITGTSRRSRSTRARGVSNAHQVSQLDASLSQTLQTNDNLTGGADWQGLVYNLGVFAAELGVLCDPGFIWSLFESFLAEISIPLHRRPEFIAALRKIWSQSANGTSSSEASFNVNGDWFNPQIQINPFTNETRSQRIKIAVAGPNKIIAIVHVHPNNSSGEPSTQSNNYLNNGLGDIGIAKKYGVLIYVLHRTGLRMYDPRTDTTALLSPNLESLK